MAKIIIGFSKPKKRKLFSTIIQVGLNIPYDHVYVQVPCIEYNRDVIYQASGLAVNFMGVDIFNSLNDVVHKFELEISDANRIAMIQFAMDNSGKPYSIKEILGLAYVRAAELLGYTIKNPLREGGSAYICSELVSFILQEYASDVVPKDYEDMTPKDVYEFLVNNKTTQID